MKKAWVLSYHWARSEDSDQTGLGAQPHFGFAMKWLNYYKSYKQLWTIKAFNLIPGENVNILLTNNFVSFEQLDPDC